jgi:hypothetical protein
MKAFLRLLDRIMVLTFPPVRYFPIRKVVSEVYNYRKGNQDPLIKHLFRTTLDFFQRIANQNGFELILDRRSFGINFMIPKTINLDFQNSWHIGFHGTLNEANYEYFLDTVAFIHRNYPRASMSLAQIEFPNDPKMIQSLQDANITMIKIDDPGEIGDSINRNLLRQISSTDANIRFAIDSEKKFFLKLRTDQHINDPFFLAFLNKILLLFPSTCVESESRIFGTSLNSFVERCCGISDMLMFGASSEMSKYWSPISHQGYLELRSDWQRKYKNPDWQSFLIPEQWLSVRYLLRFSKDLDDPVASNHKFWRDYAGVIDSNSVGQTWQRSGPYLQTSFTSFPWFKGYGPNNMREFHFNEWLTYLDKSDHSSN